MSIASSALDSSKYEGDGSGGEWDGYSTSSSDEADEDGSDAGTEEEGQGAGEQSEAGARGGGLGAEGRKSTYRGKITRKCVHNFYRY